MKINWQKLLLWGSFIFYLSFLFLRQEAAINQDLGRHLRLGEMILAGGPPARFDARRVSEASEQKNCALYTNCLTYTHPDYPFTNHHWGSEVIFYLIYKYSGFAGLIIFKALILGLVFLITIFHSLRIENCKLKIENLAIAIILTFLSIQIMAERLTLRPEIGGYLLFAILFWILNKIIDRPRSWIIYFIIPLIILLWVNLHISFIFGLILIWLWSLYQLKIENCKLKIAFIPVLSTLVTAINPNGIKGALAPLNIFKQYGYTIVENMTPFFLSQFKPQPEYLIYAALLITALILLIFSKEKPSKFTILTFLIFSIFPLIAVRHLPFFALTMPIVLTSLLTCFMSAKLPIFLTGPDFSPEKSAGTPNPATCATMTRGRRPREWKASVGYFNERSFFISSGILIFLALTNPTPLAYAKLPPLGTSADPRHQPAIQYIKEQKFQGHLWNNYDIGSFLEWELPEYQTFIDGRPEAFPSDFFQKEYIPMQESKENWNIKTKKYDIQWIFAALTDATPWFQKWWTIIQTHPDWKIVYLDDYSAVLIKKDGINKNIVPIGKAKTIEILTNPDFR